MIGDKRILAMVIVLAIILGIGSVWVYQNVSRPRQAQILREEAGAPPLEPLDPTIKVTLVSSKTKDNTVVLTATGLGGKAVSVAYELTYESQGLIKGVNSGSKPIDVNGQDQFTREVYLGTCSRNVCKPDLGVQKVSVVLEFTNTSGKKSQFSGDFSLTGTSTSPVKASGAPLPQSD